MNNIDYIRKITRNSKEEQDIPIEEVVSRILEQAHLGKNTLQISNGGLSKAVQKTLVGEGYSIVTYSAIDNKLPNDMFIIEW